MVVWYYYSVLLRGKHLLFCFMFLY